jgi:hypothetical protein
MLSCHSSCHGLKLTFITSNDLNSLFKLLDVPLLCPDYTVLSKRLRALNIKVGCNYRNGANANYALIFVKKKHTLV